MILSLLAATVCAGSLADSTITLENVAVTGQARREQEMRNSQSAVHVNREFIEGNFAGSLMQTLEEIPGVKAMSIGSGQSKPVIRGLGFNRISVTEDGVKHEGQQWGNDHGLEIDQFAIDRAEIVKGPAALLYGSDAIGGVLNLFTNHVPVRKIEGSVHLFGRSNNDQWGTSAKMGGRQNRFFYRVNYTHIDYADYKVPTDSIQYYTYNILLHDRRLRNTAGRERNGSVMLGYAGYNFHADVRISNNYAKSGFFANAHGLEVRLSDIDYDQSARDIDLPYQSVNHLKMLGHLAWHKDDFSADVNLAYQNNLREEHSEAVSHGYMPRPDGTLERRFDKDTWTANVGVRYHWQKHELRAGVNSEFQHNRCGGWGFIIPDFETFSTGAYMLDRYELSDDFVLNAGARFDFARTRIHGYSDWYKTPLATGDSINKQRSEAFKRDFRSVTWSAGMTYAVEDWILKANLGKSFRVPIPKEFGANGVNYHIFRYEQGNIGLNPEKSYQLDLCAILSKKAFSVQVNPFVNYFPNYIYLSPTAAYVEGLQLYWYQQARVFRCGFEAQAEYRISSRWEADFQTEYLYAEQLSGEKKGYTLPFSVPWSMNAGAKYSFLWLGENTIGLKIHIVGAQNEIVPPEKTTDGYYTVKLSAMKKIPLANTLLKMAFHADNLLNRRYFDHTSFYRLNDVPEPGRNFSLMLSWEF